MKKSEITTHINLSPVDDAYIGLVQKKIAEVEKRILDGKCTDYTIYRECIGRRRALIDALSLIDESFKQVYGENTDANV